MKTKFYLLLACLSMSLSGFGQRTYSVSKPSKIGIGMNALLKKQDDRCRRAPQMRGRISAETAHVLISCTDSKAVQQHLITLGITSVIHSGEMVTAEVPLNYVRAIASFKEVRNIDVSQEASGTDRPFTASNKKFGLYFIAPKGTRMDSWLGVSQFATFGEKTIKT